MDKHGKLGDGGSFSFTHIFQLPVTPTTKPLGFPGFPGAAAPSCSKVFCVRKCDKCAELRNLGTARISQGVDTE